MFKIDKGIPVLPKSTNQGRKPDFPFREMSVGDSFFAAGYVQNPTQKKNHGGKILAYETAKRQIPNSRWTTRLVVEDGIRGVRVWRTQ